MDRLFGEEEVERTVLRELLWGGKGAGDLAQGYCLACKPFGSSPPPCYACFSAAAVPLGMKSDIESALK